MLGVYGKHPGFGDFIAAGFSDAVCEGLTAWLEAVLPGVRDGLGEAWEQVYDHAAELRFWIGSGLYHQPVCGVMRASRDKVGRRFPLILGAEGSGQMPPVLDTDQRLYAALSMQLDAAEPGAGAASLLQGFDATVPDPVPLDGDQVWAIRPDGAAEDLLASVSTADHLRLAQTRSYWWTEAAPGRAAILHAAQGMPDARALTWLASGVAADQMQEAANGQ